VETRLNPPITATITTADGGPSTTLKHFCHCIEIVETVVGEYEYAANERHHSARVTSVNCQLIYYYYYYKKYVLWNMVSAP